MRESRVGLMLRLPASLRHDLAAAAKKNGWSMNAEIVDRLILSLKTDNSRVALLIASIIRELKEAA